MPQGKLKTKTKAPVLKQKPKGKGKAFTRRSSMFSFYVNIKHSVFVCISCECTKILHLYIYRRCTDSGKEGKICRSAKTEAIGLEKCE